MSDINLNPILENAVRLQASDVHLKAGLPPVLRIYGALIPLKDFERTTPDEMKKLADSIMSDEQKDEFNKHFQIDMAYSLSGVGRFRVNIFKQRGAIGIVFRVIPVVIKSFESLYLPKVLEKLSSEHRGLVLVTGITGSGKSTTLAAILDFINSNRSCHIVTIEDPIEYTHKDRKSIINQREVGVDAPSFSSALRAALRQDPDVIMVGEMRDFETIEIALTAADTGHLVLSTLHTIDAMESINRIVSVFPPYQQRQIRIQLAGIIKGIISQRLIPMKDGKDRVPAVEILVSNARIKSCIEDKEKTKEIPDAITTGHVTYGMQTFDQSIMALLKQDLITYEEALNQASNPDDFALKFKGITSASDAVWTAEGEEEEVEESGSGGMSPDIERF